MKANELSIEIEHEELVALLAEESMLPDEGDDYRWAVVGVIDNLCGDEGPAEDRGTLTLNLRLMKL